jgi:hypothetical protein
MAKSTTMAVMTPANGVRTPALDLMAVREKEPVAGYAPKNGAKMLVIPMAISSCDGWMM